MAVFFVQEAKEEKIFKLKNILNKIEINDKFITLPIKKKLGIKKAVKLACKLEENNVRNVVLSKKLNNVQELKNEIYSNNINILEGRYLFKLLIQEIIEYICKKTAEKQEDLEVSILTNDANVLNKQIILEICPKIKRLNIITSKIKEFKDVEDYLYNEKGIIIKVSNNKKTDLLSSNIIINIDFLEDVLNSYNLPKQGIIININGNIKIKTKKFNGLNINNYNIQIPVKYKIDGFYDEFVYESFVWDFDYKNVRKQILDDKIMVKCLIGEKGEIDKSEFRNNTRLVR